MHIINGEIFNYILSLKLVDLIEIIILDRGNYNEKYAKSPVDFK